MTRPPSPSASTNRFLQWSRDFFLIVGFLLLGYSGLVLLDAKVYQVFQARRLQQELSNIRAEPANTGDDGSLPANPAPAEPMGRIEIPRIGIAVVIMEGVDVETLRRAVGHIPGTALPGQRGNVGLAAHRDTFFRPLRNIQHDDVITLTTLYGTYRYLVDSTQIVEPEDIHVLDDTGGAILTLVTCYPFYYVGSAPQRFIVRAHKAP
jgi:sortase A